MEDSDFVENNAQCEDSNVFRKDQFIQRALISEEDIRHGRITSLEDVIIESEDWYLTYRIDFT